MRMWRVAPETVLRKFPHVRFPFLRVAAGNKFSGANFCSLLFFVFFFLFSVVFCIGFCFREWCFAPETAFLKILSMSGLLFWITVWN